MLQALDADAVRYWSRNACESLHEHQAEIDALNVYPVPDRDTGTNMAATMLSADDALRADSSETAGAALQAMARGAVLGARGNSGVILSQIMRGLADAAGDCEVVDAATLASGLRLGADQAWQAVAAPVDGTILTVARAAADAAPADESLAGLVRCAVAAAEDALTHTTEQLDVLADAGVVDAGGRGLVVVLDGLARAVTGETLSIPTARPASTARRAAREMGSGQFAFEVQYLLEAEANAVTALRAGLGAFGDSVAVVGTGDGTWNVHVHVNDVGAAIEAGIEAGRPRRITVAQFVDEGVTESRATTGSLDAAEAPARSLDAAEAEAGSSTGAGSRTGASAVVAVVPGQGLAHLFHAEGVRVVDGGWPTTEQVLAAVRDTGATEVVLLPNASTVAGIAEAAADQARNAGTRVTVVPTRSPVQGLAAVAVHDPWRRFDDDVVAMAEAAAATRYAEITVAERESLTSVGICQAGDVLGLIDGEVVEIGRGMVAVAFAVIDRLLGVGAEIMTVLVGIDAPNGVGDLIVGHVRERAPLTEVSVYSGGQANHPIIIGVE